MECWNSSGGTTDTDTFFVSVNVPVNGTCGTRNTTYPATTTTWPGGSTLCSAGTASPANPSFPAINSTSNWQCQGSGGGKSANCSASRVNMPAGTTFGEVKP